MSNLSFEAIRKQLQAGTAAATQQTSSVVTKTVEAAKSAGSAIYGVLPVTNNKLDTRSEDLLRMIAASTIRLQNLENAMGSLGFAMPEVQVADVDAITKSLMSLIKAPKEKEEPQKAAQELSEAHATARAEAISQVIDPMFQAATEALSAPVEQPATNVPSNPMLNSIPMSTPTNWHLGPQA